MDLYSSKANLLIIPTPGQPEQEYLAAHWANNSWAKKCDESELSASMIRAALEDDQQRPIQLSNDLQDAVNQLLDKVASTSTTKG